MVYYKINILFVGILSAFNEATLQFDLTHIRCHPLVLLHDAANANTVTQL